jgi:hypothetical protein
MHKTLFLVALLFLPMVVSAAPVGFPEHNFSIEVPAGWVGVNPVPAPMLAAYQNADGSKKFVLMVQKVSDARRALTNAAFLEGMRKGMAGQGMTLDSEQKGTIQGLPSLAVTGHLPNGVTATSYVVGAGDQMYVMQAVLNPGIAAATDAEVQSVVQSFKFLTPVPVLADALDGKSAAYRIGYMVGSVLAIPLTIGVLFLVVLGVLYLGKRARRRRY